MSDEELKDTLKTFGGDMTLPENFEQTSAPILGLPSQQMKHGGRRPLTVQVNPQTTLLCTMLEITDPNAKILGKTSQQLLDESSASPAGSLSGGSDNPPDDEEGNESGRELPSMIDSSVDISVSSTSNSPPLGEQSGWDSFHTANESLGESRLSLPSSASTPLKSNDNNRSSLILPAPSAVSGVADDDEELLSILSAQKNKDTSNSSKKDISAACQRTEESVEVSDQGPPSSLQSNNNGLKQDAAVVSAMVNSDLPTSSSTSTSTNQVQVWNLSTALISSNSCESSKSILKAERNSLGMSGLNLSSDLSSVSSPASPSFSSAIKRASPVVCGGLKPTVSAEERSEPSPTVKKLKRRNVSMYSEPPQ